MSSPPEVFAALLRAGRLIVALAAVCVFAFPLSAQHITLEIDDVTGAGFTAQGIRAVYATGATTLAIKSVQLGAQTWKDVKLDCAVLKLERARIACDDGVLALGEKIPLSFAYLSDKRALDVTLRPSANERWRLRLQPGRNGANRNDLVIDIEGGRVQRLAPWLPTDAPQLNAGVANGTLRYDGDGKFAAKIALADVGFADKSGLRAGERIGVMLEANAEPAGQQLRWRADVAWQAGEAFWQPLYLKANQQQLSAAGLLDAKSVRVERGALRFPGVGEAGFGLVYDLAAKKLVAAQVKSGPLSVPALYEQAGKSFLGSGAFADLRTDGRITADVRMDDKGLQQIDLQLDNVSFDDKNQRRFALLGLNGAVPWRANEATQAAVTVTGGELLKMPIGAFVLPLNMNGTRFELKQVRVPLLDGFIDVRDFVARAGGTSAYWQFNAEIGGIAMDKLTAALGLPVMHGTLAANIPMVRHIKSALRVDGALFLKVFDGTVEAKNLVLLDLFGKAPRVQADINMRNLDLELVTRTYSFGNITGRLDASVTGLELVNWQPVKFDARVASSAGNYPRRISQTAVQNISSLGGAGAAAAIQRSALRFFEQFGYDKLGWNCKLQNGVCEMSGVEDAPQGYVLVKGGGIPSITVIGYNRQVSWQELLARLKRVTDGGAKPIVK